jgi:mono/diheme cytochrome c family protein
MEDRRGAQGAETWIRNGGDVLNGSRSGRWRASATHEPEIFAGADAQGIALTLARTTEPKLEADQGTAVAAAQWCDMETLTCRRGQPENVNKPALRFDRNGTRTRHSEEYRMRAVPGIVQVLIVATLGFAGAQAQAADPGHGADLAKRWCATCHVVDSAQTQASADVPAFAAIARQSDFSPEKVAFFLLDPHPKMPSFPLSRSEAADIAAYIGSLRK